MGKTIFQSLLLILTIPPIYNLIEGLKGGNIHLVLPFDLNINRSERPILYWITIGICMALAFFFLTVLSFMVVKK